MDGEYEDTKGSRLDDLWSRLPGSPSGCSQPRRKVTFWGEGGVGDVTAGGKIVDYSAFI